MHFKIYAGKIGIKTEAAAIKAYLEWHGFSCEYIASAAEHLKLSRGDLKPVIVLHDGRQFSGFFELQEFLDDEGLRRI